MTRLSHLLAHARRRVCLTWRDVPMLAALGAFGWFWVSVGWVVMSWWYH